MLNKRITDFIADLQKTKMITTGQKTEVIKILLKDLIELHVKD